MTLPGFTSNASLVDDSYENFDSTPSTGKKRQRIIPAAPYWGDFRREDVCTGGKRKYSSILWGAGASWERDCSTTPAYIRNADGVTGTYYATECDNQTFNIWGIFYVPESPCNVPPPSPTRCLCSDSQFTTMHECHDNGGTWCCRIGGEWSCTYPP